jgi:hypothetical protein
MLRRPFVACSDDDEDCQGSCTHCYVLILFFLLEVLVCFVHLKVATELVP